MIPYSHHSIDESDIEAVADVLRNGYLTQGPKIQAFENAIADYTGARFAVAVSSGTAALHLACLASDLGKDDNVITSANTFVASANCAQLVGAKVHFADINVSTLNIDSNDLDNRCGELGKVKAIIPVHFGGVPCDMPRIKEIADRYDALLIEDACHALGSSYDDGGRVGNCRYACMTVFSFHPVKSIAAGEGGVVTTNDEALYESLMRLRNHGLEKSAGDFVYGERAITDGKPNPWYYEMQELGLNYRITDIQCALALSQLARLNSFLDRRRAVSLMYDKEFEGIDWLKPAQIGIPGSSAHHLYVVRIDYSAIGMPRNQVMHRLRELGVGSQVHYIPVHYHPYYHNLGFRRGQYPNAETYYDEALSIPLFFTISDEEIEQVVSSIRSLGVG